MSMRNVLAVLDPREDRLWSTFEAAVGLAERERARLTLAAGAHQDLVIWMGPLIGGVYVPPQPDPVAAAAELLARVVEFVPGDIPVTTLVAAPDLRRRLCRLVAGGCFDAVVADEHLLRHCRRLNRELQRRGIRAVPVAGGAGAGLSGPAPASGRASPRWLIPRPGERVRPGGHRW